MKSGYCLSCFCVKYRTDKKSPTPFRILLMDKDYEREIIDNFPYPIATCFTRLRTPKYRNAGSERLKHILITAERVSRYLALIVISECREHMEAHSELMGSCPLPFVKEIKSPSLGCWVGFGREGLRWLHQQQVDLVMPELHDFWFTARLKPTPAAKALNELVEIRNKTQGHDFSGLDEKEYQGFCKKAWGKLTIVLEVLAFLPRYELRFMHKIVVHHLRRQPITYLHDYSTGGGANDYFEGDEENRVKPMESEATLLLNPQTRRYLNLEPLMIFESMAGDAEDVFFFDTMNHPENAQYVACKHGGKFSLNKKYSKQDAQRREHLVAELQHLLDLFSPSDKSNLQTTQVTPLKVVR